MSGANIARALFVVLALCVTYSPTNPLIGLAVGAGLAGLGIAIEFGLRTLTPSRAVGGALGLIIGLLLARMIPVLLSPWFGPNGILIFSLVLGYAGLMAGSRLAAQVRIPNVPIDPGIGSQTEFGAKILDTSVIIDGRIADICETGFLDGPIIIPQFVLRELQLVADSADSLKRNRGRRGLDILQRLQKNPRFSIRIVEDDFVNIREVDMKLIELAKNYQAKIVTNDFNLNKVAQLRGVNVLNINELANALRPVVLPGETMRVFILKEGKEYNQGVAYLDDGTMVVVDNARKLISRTIDISVTSVLQTTAGKMIFGRFDERQHAVHEKPELSKAASSRETQVAPVAPPGL